jgi:predicted CXXCH cytochrome family protein
VARTRTTKKLAQRVDLNYFNRATAFKRAKLWLSVLVPLVAVIWIAWRGVAKDSRVYSSGRMSEAHAVLERQCAACHVEQGGQFASNAADSACLACHDGPMHHADQVAAKVPRCAECHAEHRGRINLVAVSNQICARCHANLKTQIGVSAAGVPAADGARGYGAGIICESLRRMPLVDVRQAIRGRSAAR